MLKATDERRGNALTSAVDARGIRYRGNQFGPGTLPWIGDAVRKGWPDYPYNERTKGHEGRGLFRLTLDLKTGSVTNVDVVHSTGFPGLDESAIKAFRYNWRWKPGKWKEVTIPVTFTLAPNRGRGPTHSSGPLTLPDLD